MLTILLVVAAIADLALAALLIGVSGFIFGAGPESMHGGLLFAVGYVAGIILCVAAPVAGFMLMRRGSRGLGLTLAFTPPTGALFALALPAPY